MNDGQRVSYTAPYYCFQSDTAKAKLFYSGAGCSHAIEHEGIEHAALTPTSPMTALSVVEGTTFTISVIVTTPPLFSAPSRRDRATEKTERIFLLATLKSAQGESLTAERRFAEAETVLLKAYETQRSRVQPQQYDLLQTRQRLAKLYRAWGKANETQKYMSEPPA